MNWNDLISRLKDYPPELLAQPIYFYDSDGNEHEVTEMSITEATGESPLITEPIFLTLGEEEHQLRFEKVMEYMERNQEDEIDFDDDLDPAGGRGLSSHE